MQKINTVIKLIECNFPVVKMSRRYKFSSTWINTNIANTNNVEYFPIKIVLEKRTIFPRDQPVFLHTYMSTICLHGSSCAYCTVNFQHYLSYHFNVLCKCEIGIHAEFKITIISVITIQRTINSRNSALHEAILLHYYYYRCFLTVVCLLNKQTT